MASNDKTIINTDRAPAAIGPYSQAVKANGLVFTAGQIPVDPATGTVVEGGIEAQAEQVMKNLRALLEDSGSSVDQVLKTTCFLANLDDFPVFNQIYGQTFVTDAPSRSTVQAARLPLGVLVEVECIALCN